MLAADAVEEEARRIGQQVELLAMLHVTANNPDQSRSLLRQYESMLRQVRGLPEPDDPRRPRYDPNDPTTIAMEIKADPWIGGIIRQVTEEGRRRQLEQQATGAPREGMDMQAAMAQARRERDEMLRTMGASPRQTSRPEPPPSVPLRNYSARRRVR